MRCPVCPLAYALMLVACAGPTATPTPSPTEPPEPTAAIDIAATRAARDVRPTDPPEIGTREDPIAAGDALILTPDAGGKVRISITDALLGDNAAAALKAANMFNDLAADGMQYYLLRVKVETAAGTPDAFSTWGPDVFSLVANGRAFDDKPMGLIVPDPKFEGEILHPGEIDGWIAFEAPPTEDVALVFVRQNDRGGWWFTLPEEGNAAVDSAPAEQPAPAQDESPPATEAPVDSPAPAETAGVNLANFNRIQNGMTYEEVVAILGEEGAVLSETDIAGIHTVMYQWFGTGTLGANMNAMFQNGAMIQKSQFGLK